MPVQFSDIVPVRVLILAYNGKAYRLAAEERTYAIKEIIEH
jgi:hypothetical protein